MIINALNITAESIALIDEYSPIKLSAPGLGKAFTNNAGITTKYFAMSLVILNVVNAPLVTSICLPF